MSLSVDALQNLALLAIFVTVATIDLMIWRMTRAIRALTDIMDSRRRRCCLSTDRNIKQRLAFMAEGIQAQEGFHWPEFEQLCRDALRLIEELERVKGLP